MRYLLRLSFAFALIVVLLALVGLVLPRSYRVVRVTAIAAAPELVYPMIGDLARWRDWSPLYGRDPRMETCFSTTTTEPGAWTEWRSDSQGGGRAELLEARAPERVRYRMTFADVPLATEGTIALVGTSGGRGTHVTWTSEAQLGWSPLARWFGLLLRRAEGPELERGLEALRTRAEKAGRR